MMQFFYFLQPEDHVKSRSQYLFHRLKKSILVQYLEETDIF